MRANLKLDLFIEPSFQGSSSEGAEATTASVNDDRSLGRVSCHYVGVKEVSGV